MIRVDAIWLTGLPLDISAVDDHSLDCGDAGFRRRPHYAYLVAKHNCLPCGRSERNLEQERAVR